MLESVYQAELIKRIHQRWPGCRVVKNDPTLRGQQGIPDLTLFIGNRWFLLEVKRSASAKLRPNQEYWVKKWSEITFCSFIYPENEAEVLDGIQQSLAA